MIIRRAIVKDSECIATCLLLAMEDIVYKLIGQNKPDRAKEFMLHFVEREDNQYSYQNCWVAEDDKEVVGAVNVYDGAKLSQLRQPVMDYIKSELNQDIQPEDETEAGEYYLDSLGVKPNQQGKGIGSKILHFLIDEYVNQSGQTLGLLVNEENPHAKRLYLKAGFKTVGKKVLLGKNMENLQIKG
jgi:ribosomal protein S18 acetylase RimI-like enzyme